jgi:dTDP-4-dehydrorhamnose reductase
MKILITGSGGRLGAALARAWGAAGETIRPFPRAALDLADHETLRRTVEAADFDVLVNCAALTNVDYCETHPEEAHRINADAVRVLGEVCSRKRARCVHISTDYVFDGAARMPYTEEDPAEPISHYGASKRAGEIALMETGDQHLAVRVSWVFGPDRPSFVDQILQKAQQEETVAAIADKWAVPTFTEDVAALLKPFLRDIPTGGLLHLCNGGSCTWQEYGQYALDCAAKLGVPLKAKTVGALKMADLKAFIAKRPPYTVMSTEKLTRLSGQTPRSWQEAVETHVGRMVRTR